MKSGKPPVRTLRRGPVGGSANTGGVQYGASVAAWAVARMVLGTSSRLPWRLNEEASIESLSSECDEEVDDLRLDILPVGTIYIQIKHGLKMGSEFDKAIAQLARQFAVNRPGTGDRLVIVTDATASRTVRVHVPKALSWFHSLPSTTDLADFPHEHVAQGALDRIRRKFEDVYRDTMGEAPSEGDWREFLACTHLTELNTLDEGSDERSSLEALRQLSASHSASAIWKFINALTLEGGRLRRPLNWAGIESELKRSGIDLPSPEQRLPINLESCALAVSKRRITALSRRGQYEQSLYVSRETLNEALEKQLRTREKFLLIVGGSGTGKTTWAAWQCEDKALKSCLLIAGEDIAEGDQNLRDTIGRLMKTIASEQGQSNLSEPELRRWLASRPLVVFVDGLDRALVSRRKLGFWLESTAADIDDFDWSVVLTTRPEILKFIQSSINRDVEVVGIGSYSMAEAIFAARKFGIPELAKYRHPRMMAFCKRLWFKRGSHSFLREEAISAFIQDSLSTAAADANLLVDVLEVAVDALAQELADSETGVLQGGAVNKFRLAHERAYEALRNANLIVLHQNILRVEIDDLSEHLAGRKIQVEPLISSWQTIANVPLKAGAFRSALEQLAAIAPARAIVHVRQLADQVNLNEDPVLVSQLCSVLVAFEDPSPLQELALRLLGTWKKENFLAVWGVGLDLLGMADSSRWRSQDRVELLWSLATHENALDWRQKHWLWPDLYSHNHVTPWRERFLDAVQSTGEWGLRFLIKYFDSQRKLLGSSEANLGDLAQGVFLICAGSNIKCAMDLLESEGKKGESQMTEFLAIRYPAEVRDVLLHEPVNLDIVEQVRLASAMRIGFGDLHPAAADLARAWVDQPAFAPVRKDLLRLLAHQGDVAAAEELLSGIDLQVEDVTTIYVLPAGSFKRVLYFLLSKPAFLATVLEGLAKGKMAAWHIPELCLALPAPGSSASAAGLAKIYEGMLYLAMRSEEPPRELLVLAGILLGTADASARQNLIYPASISSERSEPMPLAGREFQAELRELIAKYESDKGNLSWLCLKLRENHPQNPAIDAYIQRLSQSHPDFDLHKITRWF